MPSHEEDLDNLLKDMDDTEDIPDMDEIEEMLQNLGGDLLDDDPAEETDMDDLGDLGKLMEDDSVQETESFDSEDFLKELEGLDDLSGLDDLAGLDDLTVDDPVQETTDDMELDNLDMSDMDALLQSISEEDVDNMLSANLEENNSNTSAKGGTVGSDGKEVSDDEDLTALLAGTEDNDLQDIQDMLQKSDNGEAVDDSILSLQQDIPDEAAKVLSDENGDSDGVPADGRAEKASQRRKLKEEKKEAKRLAKEAKKAAKAAKKKAGKAGEEAAGDQPLKETWTAAEETDSEAADLLGGSEIMEVASDDDILSSLMSEFPEGDDGDLTASLEKLEEAEENDKKGLFTRVLDFFTEEDEEENEDIQLSDENQAIIEEMDKEKGKGKKKGKKSRKNKKGKDTGKKGDAAGENEEGEEENSGKGKKAKKSKKQKKEKNEKNENGEEKEPKQVDENSGKKLSKKRIILIALVCFTVMIVIIIGTNLSGDYSTKKAGKDAYYEGDYQTCYQNLYGRTLNESEQVMYNKSECILRIRLWMREYEIFTEEGSEVEALDSLIQSVNDYPELYNYAVQWNSGAEVGEIYAQMVAILSEKYHLTEEQAREIAAEPDDITYTRKVTAIAQGEAFGSWDKPEQPENAAAEIPLTDMLPEEEGISNTDFVDNNQSF